MRNKFLDLRTAQVIENQVEKILRGLGNSEPPLDLKAVRELLRLDRQFYASTDDGMLRAFASRFKVAGKRFIEKPTRIIDVVRKFDLKVLYIPDQKRVLLDASLHELKWRWNEAHEITHHVTPHHQDLTFGDDHYSISPACHEQLENEANYGAGKLLFLQSTFDEFSRSSQPTFELIKRTTKLFGNTMTSCLWS